MDARKIGAIAAAILFVACTSALAAPEMVHTGVELLPSGNYLHSYELDFTELGGYSIREPIVQPISQKQEVTDFTVNTNVQITSSWITIYSPGFNTTISTDSSHSYIDPQGSGVGFGTVYADYGIECEQPYLTDSIIKYTDNPLVMPGDDGYEDAVFHVGTMLVPGPIPEPAGLGLMGLALLAVRKRRR